MTTAMNISALFTKYPALVGMVSKYPRLPSLGYLLDKRAIEIDLADLKQIQKVFDIPGTPDESHVEKLRALMSVNTLDDLADLFQSPQAAVKIVQFFVPAPPEEGSVEGHSDFPQPVLY